MSNQNLMDLAERENVNLEIVHQLTETLFFYGDFKERSVIFEDRKQGIIHYIKF